MRKLWKQEWKYHIGFTVLATILIMTICDIQDVINDWQGFWGNTLHEGMISWAVLDTCNWMASTIVSEFFDGVLLVMTVTLLIKKGLIYWQENNLCGREFFQSLPIRKTERYFFHLCMDLVMIVVPVVIYTLHEYSVVKTYMETKYHVEASWLLHSYIGIMITTISFLIMLLGVLWLMDSLFTTGYMKLIGFGGGCLLAFLSINSLFNWFALNPVVQRIYGFFTLNSVGGNRYVVSVSQYDECDYYWLHDNLNAPVKVEGEWIDYAAVELYTGDDMEWVSQWNRLFDFSDPSSYFFYAVGYLFIGFVLIGITIYLLKKKDVSKDGFYFDAGRYLVSGVIALTIFLMITAWNGNVLQIACNLAACILLFILLLHFLNPEYKEWRIKKMVKRELE